MSIIETTIPPDWEPSDIYKKNSGFFLRRVHFFQDYLPGSPEKQLWVLGCAAQANCGTQIVVSENIEALRTFLRESGADLDSFGEFARRLGAPVVDFERPWRLQPVPIPKPWGQEIWYTGIEARGQSGIRDGGLTVPLPWVLALGNEQILGRGCRQPNLLKILDPFGDAVFGELYFELHLHKREVYVVASLDRQSWTDDTGAIRYGFSREQVAACGGEAGFRRAFLDAVLAYHQVRQEIDGRLDNIRLAAGLGENDPVPLEVRQSWLASLPQRLREKESQARLAMYRYTHEVPLQVGDIVKIEPLRPHALLHGVRTVEFQSPVYERKIISFPQKVLTQDGWDSAEAVELMNLEPGCVEQLEVLKTGAGFVLEEACRFDEFVVFRLTFDGAGEFELPSAEHHRLFIVISGELLLSGECYLPEEAALLPATAAPCTIVNNSEKAAVCLISEPLPTV